MGSDEGVPFVGIASTLYLTGRTRHGSHVLSPPPRPRDPNLSIAGRKSALRLCAQYLPVHRPGAFFRYQDRCSARCMVIERGSATSLCRGQSSSIPTFDPIGISPCPPPLPTQSSGPPLPNTILIERFASTQLTASLPFVQLLETTPPMHRYSSPINTPLGSSSQRTDPSLRQTLRQSR